MLCRFAVAPWEPEVFVAPWASQARNRFYVRGLGFLSLWGIRVLYLVLYSLHTSDVWLALFLPVPHILIHGWIQSTALYVFFQFSPLRRLGVTLPAPSHAVSLACDSNSELSPWQPSLFLCRFLDLEFNNAVMPAFAPCSLFQYFCVVWW